MANIISLDGRRLSSEHRVQPSQMFHHLRALWVAGKLEQDSYWLGNILMTVFQGEESRTIAVTHQELMGIYVTAPKGQIMSGMLQTDRLSFICGMQQLHKWAKIMSAKDQDEFDNLDAAERHFTRSPLSARAGWDADTPIFFRLPSITEEEMAANVQEAFTETFSHAQGSVVIRL